MSDLTAKKQRFINRAVTVATEADALYTAMLSLSADYFAEGFDGSGANPIADSDFAAPAEYLTAAALVSLMASLENVKAGFDNGGGITAIRKAKYE